LARADLHWRLHRPEDCAADLRVASGLVGDANLCDLISQEIASRHLVAPETAHEALHIYQGLLDQVRQSIKTALEVERVFEDKEDVRRKSISSPIVSNILRNRTTPPQPKVKGVRSSTAAKGPVAVIKSPPRAEPTPHAAAADVVYAALQAQLTRNIVRLSSWAGLDTTLAGLDRMSNSPEDKAELAHLEGKTALASFLKDCRKSPIWSLLHDSGKSLTQTRLLVSDIPSALSIPPPFVPTANASLLTRLNHIELHYLQALQLAPRCRPSLLRAVCLELAEIRFYQTALGRARSASGVASLLGAWL
jgi:hypothetical protein